MILSATILGKRGQMDLIDMSSQQDPDGYKWILRLIDHLSGHGHVRPLFTKTALECGAAIIQILSSSLLTLTFFSLTTEESSSAKQLS